MPIESTGLTSDYGPLLSSKIKSREIISIYNPQRLLQQWGYDQGTVRSTDDMSYLSVLVEENMFVMQKGCKSLQGLRAFFSQGWCASSDVTKGILFWAKCVGVMYGVTGIQVGVSIEDSRAHPYEGQRPLFDQEED